LIYPSKLPTPHQVFDDETCLILRKGLENRLMIRQGFDQRLINRDYSFEKADMQI